MRQERGDVERLRGTRAGIVATVTRDLGAGAVGDPGDRDRMAAAAVDWVLDHLERADGTSDDRGSLQMAARDAAAAGRPVAALIDAYLSAGWAIWDAANDPSPEGPTPSLHALGGRLLRAGDVAAATIADAYAEAEAQLAARGASARREYLDELLAARPGDRSMPSLVRRAPAFGLDPDARYRVVVVGADRELTDADPAAIRAATLLGPRATAILTNGGRLVVIARSGAAREAMLSGILDTAFAGLDWVAAVADAEAGIGGLGAAAAVAHDSVAVLERIGRFGRLEPVDAVAFERVLVADPAALDAAVVATLRPLSTGPRTGPDLLQTLRVFLETGANRRETARRLGVATRTVTYRLARVEALLGTRLSGPSLVRLAAVVHAATLVATAGAGVSRDRALERRTRAGSRRG